MLYGGGFNPIARATKLTRIFKEYNSTSITKSINPNVTSVDGPMMVSTDNKNPIQPGKENCKDYGNIPEVYRSGMIIIDPDLRLLSALKSEEMLLSKLGLQISPTDIVKMIKTNKGELKSALVISLDAFNKICKVMYIDADTQDSNFGKAMSKMLSMEGVEVSNEFLAKKVLLSSDLIRE